MDLNQSFSQFSRISEDNLESNKRYLLDNNSTFKDAPVINMLVDSEARNLEAESKLSNLSDVLKTLNDGIQPNIPIYSIYVSGPEDVSGVYYLGDVNIIMNTIFRDSFLWYNSKKNVNLLLFQKESDTTNEFLKKSHNKVFLTKQDLEKENDKIRVSKILYQSRWKVKREDYKVFFGNRKIENYKTEVIRESNWKDKDSNIVDISTKVIKQSDDLVIPTDITSFSKINLTFDIKMKVSQARYVNDLGGIYVPYKIVNNRPSYIKEGSDSISKEVFSVFFDQRYHGWVLGKLDSGTLTNADPFLKVVYYSPLTTYKVPKTFYFCKISQYGLPNYLDDNLNASESFIMTKNILTIKEVDNSFDSRRSYKVSSSGRTKFKGGASSSNTSSSNTLPDYNQFMTPQRVVMDLQAPPAIPPRSGRRFSLESYLSSTDSRDGSRVDSSQPREGASVSHRDSVLTRGEVESLSDRDLMIMVRHYGLPIERINNPTDRRRAEDSLLHAQHLQRHFADLDKQSSDDELEEFIPIGDIIKNLPKYKNLSIIRKIIGFTNDEIIEIVETESLRDKFLNLVHIRSIEINDPHSIEQLSIVPLENMLNNIFSDKMKVQLLYSTFRDKQEKGVYDFSSLLDYQIDYYFKINKKSVNIDSKWYETKLNRPESLGYLTELQSKYYLFKQYIERVTRIKDMSGLGLVDDIEDVIKLFFRSNCIQSLEFNDKGVDVSGVRPGFFRDMMEEVKEIFFDSFLEKTPKSNNSKRLCRNNLNVAPDNDLLKSISQELNIKIGDLFKLAGATVARVLLVDNGAHIDRHLFCDLKLCYFLLARLSGEEFNLDPNPSWPKVMAILKQDSRDTYTKYYNILFKSDSEILKMVNVSDDIKEKLGLKMSKKKNKSNNEEEKIKQERKSKLIEEKSRLEELRSSGVKMSDGKSVVSEIMRIQQEISRITIELLGDSSESNVSSVSSVSDASQTTGKHITNQNKLAFCYLDIMRLYQHQNKEAIYNFCRGFHLVMSESTYNKSNTMSMLTIKDLSKLLEGEPANIEQIIDLTEFEESNSIVKDDDLLRIERLFYEVLEEFNDNKEFIEKLMIFWTNQKTLTNNKLKVVVLRHKDGESNLPTSATCFFRLKLYNYPGDDKTFKKTLKDKLITSVMGASREIYNGGGPLKNKTKKNKKKNINNSSHKKSMRRRKMIKNN